MLVCQLFVSGTQQEKFSPYTLPVHTLCMIVCVCVFLIFSSLLCLLYLLKCNGLCRGFCGSVVKNLLANAGDGGSILGSGRSPGEEMATHSILPAEKSHGQRSLAC